MATGYEMEPAPIGRRKDRRPPAIVAAVVIFLTVVVLKPWDGAAVAPSTVLVGPTATVPVASAGEVAAAGSVVSPVRQWPAPTSRVSPWPATASPSTPSGRSSSLVVKALGTLATHAGTWGVGNAGAGPRLLRDEPWADWAAVAPEAVGDAPAHIATWPDTDACMDVPAIFDRPSIVAITAPDELVPNWHPVGWWTDGTSVADLVGSVRQVSSAGNNGITYLERIDSAPWPPGRYEFHVIAGGRTVALTVCLTRGG